jgi:hypothetical protein
MKVTLGRLERVELRAIWADEARGLTPWLATEENLKLLGDTIDIELELEAQERDVGPFRADILCKDTRDDSWVLIENQIERTDHRHLGQLLTYASGLDAVTIVWIAGSFIDEHRAALDWLNRITAENFRFFGLEIELWRIGTSPAAPKFNVVAKPNDWAQSVGQAARSIASGALNERGQRYIAYWGALSDFLSTTGSRLKLRKPLPHYWFDIGIGRAGITLTALAGFRDKWIAVDLIIRNDPRKLTYRSLLTDRDTIQSQLGFELDWHEMAGKDRSRIEIRQSGVDPMKQSDWPAQHDWIAKHLIALDRVFRPRVQALPKIWTAEMDVAGGGHAADTEQVREEA